MKWAFIDYENIGSLEEIIPLGYDKLIIFCGPKNHRIKFGTLPSGSFCSIELVGITTMGPNNLDFHLTFYLGKFNETTPKEVEFDVISNDTGFDGIVEHLNTLQRVSKRVSFIKSDTTTPKEVFKPKVEPIIQKKMSQTTTHVISRIEHISDPIRPKTKEKVLNSILSYTRSLENAIQPEEVFQELIEHRKIKLNGTEITYNIPAPSDSKDESALNLVIQKLKQTDGRKRPRKKDKLLNWIKSCCQKLSPSVNSKEVFQELIQNKKIVEKDSAITYHIKK